jgi:hypothetical protein
MATLTFFNGEMCLAEFVAHLPSLSFEPITEKNELGWAITTYSSKEDVKAALEKVFKEIRLTVKFDGDTIFESYFCSECHSTKNTMMCCYEEPHYTPNDET